MVSAQCKAEVPNSSGWGYSQCLYGAKYGDYCGVHSPEKQAERAKDRGPTQYERDCTAREKQRKYVEGLEAELADAVALLRDAHAEEEEGVWIFYAGSGEVEWLAKRLAFLSKHPAPSPEGGESDE